MRSVGRCEECGKGRPCGGAAGVALVVSVGRVKTLEVCGETLEPGVPVAPPVQDVVHFVDPPHHEHEGMDEASIMEHEQVTKVKVRAGTCVHGAVVACCGCGWSPGLRVSPFLAMLSFVEWSMCSRVSVYLGVPPDQNVSFIELGRHRMETWYFSPFPKEYYADGVVETVRAAFHCMCTCVHAHTHAHTHTPLPPSTTARATPLVVFAGCCVQMYICEFCLKFFVHKAEHVWHLQKCVRRVSVHTSLTAAAASASAAAALPSLSLSSPLPPPPSLPSSVTPNLFPLVRAARQCNSIM